jgi:hypothetical protein
MPVELLTYQALAERLGISAEAARALAKRLHLPRRPSNDGKALVAVDLSEIQHKPKPARSSADHQPDVGALKLKLEMLRIEVAKLEAAAAGNRADYERERERGDQLAALAAQRFLETDAVHKQLDAMVAELTAMARLMTERETAADEVRAEFDAYRSRPWWRRLVG